MSPAVTRLLRSKELLPGVVPVRRSASEPLLPGQRRLQQTAVDQLHQTGQGRGRADRRAAADGTVSGDETGRTDAAVTRRDGGEFARGFGE